MTGEVRELCEERSTAALLPALSERIAAGETIDLGALEFTGTTVTLNHDTVRWDQVTAMREEKDPENGTVDVIVETLGGEKFTLSRSSIANFPVFLKALRDYTGLRFSDQP